MILDGYWKKELKRIGRILSHCSRCGFLFTQGYSDHKINQCFLYSAVIIRKISEDEKEAERIIKEKQLKQPPLPVLKINIPVTRFDHTDEDKLFVNSRVILEDYDMKNGRADDIPLMQVCNQIIHSYPWGIVHQGKRGVYGALVASDREKEKDVILIAVSDWIAAIEKVTEEANIY